MKYENPICEILEFKTADVISTSDGGDGPTTDWGPDGDPTNI